MSATESSTSGRSGSRSRVFQALQQAAQGTPPPKSEAASPAEVMAAKPAPAVAAQAPPAKKSPPPLPASLKQQAPAEAKPVGDVARDGIPSYGVSHAETLAKIATSKGLSGAYESFQAIAPVAQVAPIPEPAPLRAIAAPVKPTPIPPAATPPATPRKDAPRPMVRFSKGTFGLKSLRVDRPEASEEAPAEVAVPRQAVKSGGENPWGVWVASNSMAEMPAAKVTTSPAPVVVAAPQLPVAKIRRDQPHQAPPKLLPVATEEDDILPLDDDRPLASLVVKIPPAAAPKYLPPPQPRAPIPARQMDADEDVILLPDDGPTSLAPVKVATQADRVDANPAKRLVGWDSVPSISVASSDGASEVPNPAKTTTSKLAPPVRPVAKAARPEQKEAAPLAKSPAPIAARPSEAPKPIAKPTPAPAVAPPDPAEVPAPARIAPAAASLAPSLPSAPIAARKPTSETPPISAGYLQKPTIQVPTYAVSAATPAASPLGATGSVSAVAATGNPLGATGSASATIEKTAPLPPAKPPAVVAVPAIAPPATPVALVQVKPIPVAPPPAKPVVAKPENAKPTVQVSSASVTPPVAKGAAVAAVQAPAIAPVVAEPSRVLDVRFSEIASRPSQRPTPWEIEAAANLADESLGPELAEMARRIQQELSESPHPVVAIADAGGKSESGRIVGWLGMILAQRHGARVLLIDADRRHRGLSCAFQLDRSAGISEVARGEKPLREAIIATATDRLHVLPAGLSPGDDPRDALAEVLAAVREPFTWVLISGGSAEETQLGPFAKIADATLLAVRLGETAVESATSVLDGLRLQGARVLGCIVTSALSW